MCATWKLQRILKDASLCKCPAWVGKTTWQRQRLNLRLRQVAHTHTRTHIVAQRRVALIAVRDAKRMRQKNFNEKCEFRKIRISKWKCCKQVETVAENGSKHVEEDIFKSFQEFFAVQKVFWELPKLATCESNRLGRGSLYSAHTLLWAFRCVCVWKVTMLLSQRENLSFSRKIKRKLRQMQQKLQIAHGKSKAMESGGGAGHSTDTWS